MLKVDKFLSGLTGRVFMTLSVNYSVSNLHCPVSNDHVGIAINADRRSVITSQATVLAIKHHESVQRHSACPDLGYKMATDNALWVISVLIT